jgi:hypothetical protein
MATVARFDGIKIQFYWDEHPPAHFHVEYGEYRAQVAIDSLKIIKGYIPSAQFGKVKTWARSRKSRLFDAWMRCQSDLHPGKIA